MGVRTRSVQNPLQATFVLSTLIKIVACIRAANKILFSGYEADKNRELRWWFGGVVVVALGIRGPDVCTFPEPPVVGKVVQVDTPTNSP